MQEKALPTVMDFSTRRRHHPDRDSSPDAPLRFVAIHEAYSTLIGRGQGKEDEQQPRAKAGWDFHDW